jgi:Holliday junction resolvase-like predicted endonuclease
MFGVVDTLTQGDLGEASAIEWLASRGYPVWVPVGRSPDCDLVTRIDGRLSSVQVKTCRRQFNGRFPVMVCTKGGIQSWNGVVKRFSATRCDWLFVLAADGRRWFIPSSEVGGGSGIMLGGPKYAAYEVEPGRPLSAPRVTAPLNSMTA